MYSLPNVTYVTAVVMRCASCCCSVAVGLLLGVLLVLLIKPPAGFSKHVIVMTGLGERVAQHLL
jgi:ABC-type methionine transport system permease subunit